MIDLVLIFSASFVIGLSGAVMPGPLLALTLKESLSRGGVAALWLSGGHSFCELLLVTAIVAGVSRVVSVDTLAGPVGLLGGIILIWMGIGAFRQTDTDIGAIGGSAAPSTRHNLLFGGAAVTVSNPYWLVWWLTVGLGLVLSATKAGLAGIAAFYLGHISSDFLWFGLIGFGVGWRGNMLNDSLYRRILQACAIFLVGFGLLFVGYGGRTIHLSLTR